MKKKYTFEEAVDTVVEMRNILNTMPTHEDYIRFSNRVDLDGLAKALKVEESMKENNVRPYAAVNIAVLRELRRRNGEIVYIANYDASAYSNSNLFENRIAEA